jgi:hypothetical protein
MKIAAVAGFGLLVGLAVVGVISIVFLAAVIIQ